MSKKRGRKPTKSPLDDENQRLRREIVKLKGRLAQAEVGLVVLEHPVAAGDTRVELGGDLHEYGKHHRWYERHCERRWRNDE